MLLPNVFLGPAMPWFPYYKLYERLLMQTKRGLEHCPEIPQNFPLPVECLNYFTWTAVPWDFLYDMTMIKQRIRLIQRDDLSHEWIYKTFGLNKKDIYFVKDSTAFDFRIFDDPASTTGKGKYNNRVELGDFEKIEKKVIQFGSLFGSYRVLAQKSEHAELSRFLREQLIFRNPNLIKTADRIVEKLGGQGAYVGVHLRVGDGLFARRAGIIVDDIYHALVMNLTDLTPVEVDHYEGGRHDEDRKEDEDYEVKRLNWFSHPKRDISDVNVTNLAIAIGDSPEDLLSPIQKRALPDTVQDQRNLFQYIPPPDSIPCPVPITGPQDPRTSRFSTRIFIATDARKPRMNPLLRKIFNTFPCVLTLDDFSTELVELRALQIEAERVSLEPYLIPMVDAIIASRGLVFFGTKDSTFSTYIERQLHPVYTGKWIKGMGAGKKGVKGKKAKDSENTGAN